LYVTKIINEVPVKRNTKLLRKLSRKLPKKMNSQIRSLEDELGNRITNPKEICNMFNKYFSEIGIKKATNIKNFDQK